MGVVRVVVVIVSTGDTAESVTIGHLCLVARRWVMRLSTLLPAPRALMNSIGSQIGKRLGSLYAYYLVVWQPMHRLRVGWLSRPNKLGGERWTETSEVGIAKGGGNLASRQRG